MTDVTIFSPLSNCFKSLEYKNFKYNRKEKHLFGLTIVLPFYASLNKTKQDVNGGCDFVPLLCNLFL